MRSVPEGRPLPCTCSPSIRRSYRQCRPDTAARWPTGRGCSRSSTARAAISESRPGGAACRRRNPPPEPAEERFQVLLGKSQGALADHLVHHVARSAHVDSFSLARRTVGAGQSRLAIALPSSIGSLTPGARPSRRDGLADSMAHDAPDASRDTPRERDVTRTIRTRIPPLAAIG